MTIRRCPLAFVSLMLLAAMSGGCSSTPSATGPDVTGGRTIEMYVESAGRKYERYLVGTDGVLHFGGGVDARKSNYTWSGPLMSAETSDLTMLIERHGWREADPPSTGVPPEMTYTIKFSDPDRKRSFTVLGDPPAVAEVRRLFDTAARRRHDTLIQALPKPGIQK